MAQLLVIGVTLSLFTALYLVSRRDKNSHDDILALWLLVMAMPVLLGVAMRNFPDLQIPVLPDLTYPLTFGPLMWLYVESLTGHINRIDRRHLLHFLPFALTSLLKNLMDWKLERPTPMMETFSLEIRIAGAVYLAVLAVYSIAVFRRLRQHGTQVPEHFSQLSGRVTLVWLRWITAALTGTYLLLFLGCVLPFPPLLIVHILALTGVILVLCFFGLRQTQLCDTQEVSSASEEERKTHELAPWRDPTDDDAGVGSGEYTEYPLGTASPRYSRSGLCNERAEAIAQRLEKLMEVEKPYLDPELTIETLARQIAVPRHYLTQVINERYEKNFFLFVNEYRIDSVKNALRSADQADRTLLEIAFDSGFSSKSTFNAAFKQFTGMTPSQFRATTA